MKAVPYYVLALAMAVPALLVGVEIPSWFVLRSQGVVFQSDLRVFYAPAYMVRTGQRKEIYSFSAIRRNQDERIAADNAAVPFLHPAYEVLAFVPLSLLSYRAAYFVWAALNLLVLGWIYFLLQPYLSDLAAISPQWAPPALLLGFMPVGFTILAGQDSLLLLLILVLVYRRVASHELQAGILLGMGMFRFQVLLPIVALFLAWRGLKFLAGWVMGSAAVLGISAAITGVAAQIQYARLLLQMGGVSEWLLTRRMPNLRALLTACGLGRVPLVLVYAAILALVAILGARQDSRRKLLLAVTASALVTYYLFLHDLSILALPLLVAINEAIAQRDWIHAALVVAALAGFSTLWVWRDSFYLGSLFTVLFLGVEAARMWKRRKLVEAGATALSAGR